MIQHGGEVDLIAMYDGNDMEGAYLKAALGRLMVTCDFKDIATYESSVRRMEASHGKVNPELNPLMLNQDMLELIKLDAREANERIGKKGFFRWQEENRKPGDILMEGSNNLAYGLMMYHSAMVEMDALSRQQRDVKMPRKAEQQREIKQQGEAQNGGQEGKAVEGGRGVDELVLKGTGYSSEYAQKLKDTYKIFKNNGYEISEHGLNRILDRINQGKIGSIEEVLDVMKSGTKYVDTVNGGTVLYKNKISIHIADDGFIKTVIGNAKIKSTWEIMN